LSAPLLKITNASKVFKVGSSTVKAVTDVNLTVETGETVAIVGESGSGKTTLANLILGIESLTSGEISLAGELLGVRRSKAMRRQIGLVQQNPYSTLNPRKSVGSAIRLPLSVHRIGARAERAKTVVELLRKVGLNEGHMDRRPLALSGGQRQRVAIARALTTNPNLLVLDEPTSSLDVSVQAHILHLLRDVQADYGLTYLFITHDLGVVRVIASRVVVMYRGRVVEEGTSESIFLRPRHRYTQLLLASIPTVSAEDDAIKPHWPWELEAKGSMETSKGCPFQPRCPFAVARCSQEVPAVQGDASHRHACFNPLPMPAETAAPAISMKASA
jgi:peptide/nickel transport system ATP-binding protein/oligopeptide transport system ATP-binding protein